MKENNLKQLNQILNNYDQKQNKIVEAKEKEKTEIELFTEDFKRFAEQVIHPIFENIRAELKARGHDADILNKDETTDDKGRKLPSIISMNIYPSGVERSEYNSDNTPRIAFVCNPDKRNFYSHVNTIQPNVGGSAGARDFFELDKADSDAIASATLIAVGDIFSRK